MNTQATNSGFTLLEVMVSLVVFSAMITGIVGVFGAHTRINNGNEIRLGALAVTQQVLDDLRQQENTEDFPNSGSDPVSNITVDKRTYQATTSYCVNSTYCDSISKRHITVEVAYKGHTVSTVQTVFTRLK